MCSFLGIKFQLVQRSIFFVNAFFILLFFVGTHKSYGQCPEIDKNDYHIETSSIEQKGAITIILDDHDLNLGQYNIQLFNYDQGIYIFDKKGNNSVKSPEGFQQSISNALIQFEGLNPGDYVIIVSGNNCEKLLFGLNYSGFPSSAIRIE